MPLEEPDELVEDELPVAPEELEALTEPDEDEPLDSAELPPPPQPARTSSTLALIMLTQANRRLRSFFITLSLDERLDALG